MSPHRRRVLQLLAGGLAGGALAGLTVTISCWVVAGASAGVSAALAAGVVIAFFSLGQGLQAVVADASPTVALVAALGSYVVRVVLLGALLSAALAGSGAAGSLSSGAVVWGTIAVALGWIAGEVITWLRLRIPVYDSTETGPTRPGPG